MRKTPILLGIALASSMAVALTVDTPPAQAFPFLYSWHQPSSGPANTNRAGAGGIYGTGGPFEYGIQCAHCHIGGVGMVDVNIQESPAFGMVGNDKTYTPGQKYDFVVTLQNEHLGLNQMMDNLNAFSATFEDPGGVIMGQVSSDSQAAGACAPAFPSMNPPALPVGTTYVQGDCHGITPIPNHNDTQWIFSWVAPPAGSGEVTMWWGVVDGDHAGKSSLDDDVKQGSTRLVEGS